MKKLIVVLLLCLIILSGCSGGEKDILDPERPINITIWHYYNGQTKEKFDSMVSRFNESVGGDRGVVVDAKSHSDVDKLADAVYNAANKNIGSQPLPDIFAAYPENAFRVNQIYDLVNLDNYFSEAELNAYYPDFIKEGRLGENQKLIILPIAKSSEVMYLNKTAWEKFAAESDAVLADLQSWEGIAAAAEKYYKDSGSSFFSIDSTANFFMITAVQLGEEIYDYQANGVEFNFDRKLAEKIWEVYYIPYIKGYYNKMGRFSSDDARTGIIQAYTGSTAGAGYFPREVILSENESYEIDVEVLPYPYFQNGEPYAFQQGAGMVVTESDEASEYGSTLFLKWFTEKEQNIEFSLATGYFPVKTESLDEEVLLTELEGKNINPAVEESIKTSIRMFNDYNLYANKPFAESYEMRFLLSSHLFDRIERDKEILNSRINQGENRTAVISELSSTKNFEDWYQQLKEEAAKILRSREG
jgi:multiple sugar transport system substrate-binding protein